MHEVPGKTGRPGRELDPEAGPLAAFAYDLAALRRDAGLTVRQLASRAYLSSGAISTAANGRALPTLEVTRAYVAACGGDVADWEARWGELDAARRNGTELTEPAEPVVSVVPDVSVVPAVSATVLEPVEQPAALAPFVPTSPASADRHSARYAFIPARGLGRRLAAAMAGAAVALTAVLLVLDGDGGDDSAATAGTPAVFLGAPDFAGYCEAAGRGTAVSGSTAYDWHCTDPKGEPPAPAAQDVCMWSYGDERAIDRIADFSDPGSIECWSVTRELGRLDFDAYCRKAGYGRAVQVRDTVYAWYCNGTRGIDSQAACALLYSVTPAVSRFSDYSDPNSWTCHA
ncbi:helix-turn-helix domain-containing protein [Yinghuangia soli]|uniref:Helix-turn-helix transcriptional regulator n=1 Tax=Yinghuangia soli TaxID=2908204 RepID=A0AA41PZD8_9ACTN|nr:helix-turn-helix transcriptional regulator [Yinghuangia soli]MCF2528397.1 helix-turn-helix transcriptional regulator [Yinghuangia soli]